MTMQQRRRWALAGLVAVAATLVPVALAPHAQANHGNPTLEVTKELNRTTLGESVTLTAKLSAAPAVPVKISFEVEDPDNTPQVPDAECTVATTATTCTAAVTTAVAGTHAVRAWVDHDGTPAAMEQDTAEGRLSDPVRDCQVNDDYTATDRACLSGTVTPGNVAEPDITDVVEITFSKPGLPVLDCDGDEGRDRTGAPSGANKRFACRVTDSEGNPRGAGQVIDAENISSIDDGALNGTGANDPDDDGDGSAPDYSPGTTGPNNSTIQNGMFCTTDSNGVCSGEVANTEKQEGRAIFCFWLDSDADNVYDPAGGNDDGGDCDVERVDDVEGDDATDRVEMTWAAAVPTVVRVEPDTATSAPGTTVKLTAVVEDQFGAKMKAKNVHAEFFTGSVNDGDGTTTSIPDGVCSTGDTGECTFEVSAAREGADRICFWHGAAPVASGNVDNGVCASEGVSPDTDNLVDVVLLTWKAGSGGTPTPTGYWMVGSDGGIFAFGDADFKGSMGGKKLNAPIVGMTATPNADGYWFVASDGGIFAFNAPFKGSMGGKPLNAPIVGIAAHPSGQGYWMVARDGGIFAFGDATFKGSMGGKPLNSPIVGIAAHPSGEGYWMVAADGGIFNFGAAPFKGSMGGKPLAAPMVGMAAHPNGQGYWMVASDGGIFGFDAPFRGSTGSIRLAQPIVGMSTTKTGDGYRFVARDGGIFAFNAPFKGSMGGQRLVAPIVGMAGF